MPKLYFYDTALACNLLRITNADDVYNHYLRGGLFESMILSDLLKTRFNACMPPNAYFWRDKNGNEIDCILEESGEIKPIEIKSTETLNSNLFDGLKKWSQISNSDLSRSTLVYSGLESQIREGIKVISWKDL